MNPSQTNSAFEQREVNKFIKWSTCRGEFLKLIVTKTLSDFSSRPTKKFTPPFYVYPHLIFKKLQPSSSSKNFKILHLPNPMNLGEGVPAMNIVIIITH